MRTDCAVFSVGNRQKDPVAYRLPDKICPFACLRCLKVFFGHKSPLLCRICLPEMVQAFFGLPHVYRLRAATSAGGWLLFATEAGRTSCASPPEPGWQLEAHPLYTGGVSRVSLIPNTRLVKIAQSCVHNGTDTRLRRFYYDVLGKSKKSFLLQSEDKHGKHKET